MPQELAVLRRKPLPTRLATIGLLVLILPTWVMAASPGKNGVIAFQSTDGGTSNLAVVNPDGTGLRPLPFPPGQAGVPSWSPDGTQIAFVGDPGGPHLWTMNFLTGVATPLTVDNYVYDGEPTWSPDGSKVAFTRCGGMPISCGIWVVNADGTSPVNLTQTRGSHDLEPAWSPDGSRIAFRTVRDGNVEIYVMSSDGSGAQRLTITPEAVDYSPDWSPDGGSIVFSGLDAEQGSTIWTMNADGANLVSLGPGEQPAYSPDGTRIAFVLTTGSSSDLWTMNADGTGRLALVATSANESWPSWQPLSACGSGNGSGSNGQGKCKGNGNGNAYGHEKH